MTFGLIKLCNIMKLCIPWTKHTISQEKSVWINICKIIHSGRNPSFRWVLASWLLHLARSLADIGKQQKNRLSSDVFRVMRPPLKFLMETCWTCLNHAAYILSPNCDWKGAWASFRRTSNSAEKNGRKWFVSFSKRYLLSNCVTDCKKKHWV